MAVDIQQQLLRALRKVDRPGTFCTSGRLPALLPGLEVKGVGPVALPLEKRQAASLKKQARQAPYGKGERTLVDTKVRRVWEIDADRVTFANPEWPGVVTQAVRMVQSELGLEKQKLDAHLYKLLLYEPGSFFLSHRDGEKLDRMVATLVIALPSAHEGGRLLVRHDGREETVDFGGTASAFHVQFAAFYADCEHEIRPVKNGFRLILAYNLTLAKSKRQITAPTSGEHIATISRILGPWQDRGGKAARSDEDEAAFKLAVLLDHEYTQAGLSYDALKGVDRTKADVLFEGARRAGCDAYLALVTFWETGSAEPTGDDHPYSRYGYDAYDDGGEHEMGEVFDESLTAEHFSDVDGKRLDFGRIPLEQDEIVSEEPIGQGEPDQEDFEGYTGNEGMTLERWYHRAAVMLWPADARFDVLCEAGVEAAVGGLEQMLRKWKKAKKREQEALKTTCLEFAARIIDHWPTRELADRYDDDEASTDLLLPLLEALDDASLVGAWIRGVLAKDASVDPGKALGDICARQGWLRFQDDLKALFRNTSNETIERHARLLADWSLRKDRNADRRKLCALLAHEMMPVLARWDPRRAGHDWRAREVDRARLLPPLAQTFISLEQADLFEQFVAHVLDRPKVFDLTTVQIPALLGLEAWLKRNVKQPRPPLHRWLTAIREELESRAAHPPREPADWRRESAIPCKCADCKELSRFLKDPGAETFRLPLAQHRRQHLHQVIDTHKLDTTHVTERRGRPYTLVFSKTKASYERALKAHHIDLDHLQKIRNMLAEFEGLT